MRTIIPRSVIGTDSSTRIPTPNLPPPYTSGTRAGQSRYVLHAREETTSFLPRAHHRRSITAPKTTSPDSYPTRPTNPSDLTTTSKLLVGPKSTPFLIHTSLLTAQSSYFRVALTGPFAEATENTITLDDVSVDHFQLVTSWLYNGVLTAPFKDGKPAYYTLLHVYVLADRFLFEGLRNAVVDMMSDLADRTNSVLTPSDTRILYDSIRDSAPLRRLVLDLFAFKKTDRLLETHGDWWHAEFLRDLSVLLKRPCGQALGRHRLRLWCPESWHTTRACEHCRMVLPPRVGAVVCEDCCVAFCTRCVEGGVAMAGWDEGRSRLDGEDDGREENGDTEGGATGEGRVRRARKWEACKPWRGARCLLYHEHDETKRCGDVFLGR